MSPSVFTFDDVPFERRLAETIAWCAPRATIEDPKMCLRSEQLRPALLARDRASTVRSVARYRDIEEAALPAITGPESLLGGHLLVYFPDDDLCDGASEVASRGFFDVHNVPPWDTWVALADDGPQADISFRQYLIAWVPPYLLGMAQEGIAVNVEDCIAWLDESRVGARDELRHLLTR
jgi:hypothetical protein